jgi:hypothetical protein
MNPVFGEATNRWRTRWLSLLGVRRAAPFGELGRRRRAAAFGERGRVRRAWSSSASWGESTGLAEVDSIDWGATASLFRRRRLPVSRKSTLYAKWRWSDRMAPPKVLGIRDAAGMDSTGRTATLNAKWFPRLQHAAGGGARAEERTWAAGAATGAARLAEAFVPAPGTSPARCPLESHLRRPCAHAPIPLSPSLNDAHFACAHHSTGLMSADSLPAVVSATENRAGRSTLPGRLRLSSARPPLRRRVGI